MRILVADDDIVSRRLLEHALTRLGHEVETACDGPNTVTALLRPDAPQIAIIDWEMPGADGLVVCRVIRQRPGQYTHIVMLTSRTGRENVGAALEAGADDFLIKPFDTLELQARLRSGQRIIELQRGLLSAQEALRVVATNDDLTGLSNRRVVLAQLERESRRAHHENRPIAVAMADIDFFQKINNEHGRAAGDAVLQHMARCLQLEVRDYDTAGRFGGDEFCVVLPGCDADGGQTAMERVRKRVAITPAYWNGVVLPVTVSVGVAWTFPDGLDTDTLHQRADQALYRAKGRGRNCVEVANMTTGRVPKPALAAVSPAA